MLCALPGRWRCKWGLTQRKQIEFNWLCYLLKCEQFRGNLLTDLPTPAYERTHTLSHLTSIVIKTRLGCGCDENLTVTAPITTLLQTKILDFVLWIYWSHLVSQPWMVQMNTTVIYCSLSITTLSRWLARSWIWISSRIFAHSLSSISSDVPLLDLPVFHPAFLYQTVWETFSLLYSSNSWLHFLRGVGQPIPVLYLLMSITSFVCGTLCVCLYFLFIYTCNCCCEMFWWQLILCRYLSKVQY